jgi:hypothetical protein
LDIYSFTGEPNRLRQGKSLPIFLYDDNIFNDYKYLLNIDVAIASLRAIIKPFFDKDNILYDYNYMWQWQHEFKNKFGKEKVLNQWLSIGIKKKIKKNLWTIEKLKLSFNQNLFSIIQKHPETKFIIFYPPYSILLFYDWSQYDILNSAIRFKYYVFKKLKSFKNVEIYDFQIAEKIILDLDNYRDYSHYHQKINTWMLQEISLGHYKVTEANIKLYEQRFLDMIKNYKNPKLKECKDAK